MPAAKPTDGPQVRTAVPAEPLPVKVMYAKLDGHGSGFAVVIFIMGRKDLGRWTLGFVLPGTRIAHVLGATWAPRGPDGGVVSGIPWPWPRSGANGLRVVIFGTGDPRWPRACVFNGIRCSFHRLSPRAQHYASAIPVSH